jgi:hypothetical protein
MQPQPDSTERTFWEKNRYLLRESAFAGAALANLTNWTDELAAWPESPGQWMKYFERADRDDRQLCRVENFLEYHRGFRDIILGTETMKMVSSLMGEPALLFKEKLNYKLPGGSGFLAHQDAPAFASFEQKYHITMLVTVDAMNVANGCLEVSDPVVGQELLAQEADGTVSRAVEAERNWYPLEIPAGSVLFFDSYIPHRSASNGSALPRRALYITYNRAREGDRREAYYVNKRAVFPPECEREPNVDYGAKSGPFNLGNPIR